MKHYNLNLPAELYTEVEAIANRRQSTVVAMLRQFIKIGLLADKIEQDANSDLLVRENGETRIITL
jgi:hypothetical protein